MARKKMELTDAALSDIMQEVHSPAEPEADDLPLFFDSPESKSVAAAQYDPDREYLTVSFSGSGGVKYGGGGIPMAVWREFYQADSKGAYFNKHIRPLWDGKIL